MEGYMIAPLNLTERQLLIYYCLYKKCDFDKMEVAYTTQQIITDIKLINLTTRIVNSEIKTLIEGGYIKLVKKGSKGNASVYSIIRMNEKTGNLKVTNRKLKRKSKSSNSNTFNDKGVTNRELISNSNVTPINEKEKDIIYSIVKKLNIMASTNYKPTTKNTVTLVKARLKEGYEVEDFYKVIEAKCEDWIGTEFEKFLRPATLFGNKFEGYLNQSIKKAPVAAGAENKNSYKKSICNTSTNNTQKVEVSKFK